MTQTLTVQDIEVLIDGDGPTVVMLHGWPDSPALWDESVAALKDGYRCVRFALPGYDLRQPPRPVSVDQMCELVAAIIDAVSPDAPVTLMLHDWGCFFGYEVAARHLDRVSRVVGADIGDTNTGAYLKSLTAKEKAMIAGYQLWLAVAWKLGPLVPGLANRMTRWMARSLRCPTDAARISWQMNYPYVMQWFGLAGGFRGAAQVKPNVPLLYCYGERKPFMFHSAKWLALQAGRADCAVQGFPCGHWVMLNQTEAFNRRLRDWLTRSETTVYSHKPG